ncbi:glycosyltransferase 52 family protein [Vibrio clamense]|uniref:glycosyltransferase 52 family protein n=1 Tax=Vibrio TaxID=662 RepID=UPI0014935C76|nr:glycosyltransferase 52 family protein [Vibrio sp. 03-59-1]NOH84574.1 glycosyltransferase 52 family protein [Vibrio sp. 03-59-1]
MNVFVITSPFQYICANEARVHFGTTNNLLVLVEQVAERGKKNMEEILDESVWDKIIRIPRSNRTFHVPKVINKIKKHHSHIDHLFLSEYHGWRSNVFIQNVLADKIIYLDDGLATLVEYEEEIRPQKSYTRKRLLNDFLLRIQGIAPPSSVGRLPNFEMFTVFKLPEDNIKLHKNTMSDLRSTLDSKACFDPNGPIGFIGEANVGVYKEGIQPEGYLSTIKSVIQESGKRMIYFPHRMEQDDIFKAVSELEGVTIHNSSSPIEREIGKEKIKLSKLYGYSSTALYTLSIIYSEIPLQVLKNEDLAGTLSDSFNQYLMKQFES